MENQHRKITGYRELTQEEIDTMNRIKAMGNEEVQALIEQLQNDPNADKRWLAIAETHLQQGFMALIRSVAKPTTFV